MATGFYGFPVLRALKENHLTGAYVPQQRPVGPFELTGLAGRFTYSEGFDAYAVTLRGLTFSRMNLTMSSIGVPGWKTPFTPAAFNAGTS